MIGGYEQQVTSNSECCKEDGNSARSRNRVDQLDFGGPYGTLHLGRFDKCGGAEAPACAMAAEPIVRWNRYVGVVERVPKTGRILGLRV